MTEPYDRTARERDAAPDSIEDARENVLDGWPSSEDVSRFIDERRSDRAAAAFSAGDAPDDEAPAVAEPESSSAVEPEPEPEPDPEPTPEPDAVEDEAVEPEAVEDEAFAPLVDPDPIAHASSEHAPGELAIPPGYSVLEGAANGARRAVGVVVSRFNGDVTDRKSVV